MNTWTIATAAMMLALAAPSIATAQATTPDWSPVEAILGRRGMPQPTDVMRFSFPRRDLRVVAAGIALKPGFALGSWVAMRRVGGEAMAMGDLVLTDDEVNPVIARLLEGGIHPTAVHNHLLGESPHIEYVHIAGHGDAVALARTVRSALEATRTPLDTAPAGPAAALDLDTAAIIRALGRPGRVNGGVLQFSVARAEPVREAGQDIPASMGLATAINVQSAGGGRAAITGDFVMRAEEVDGVMRALRSAGIDITALHSHMLDEEPRLFFMHFWAAGDPAQLARGLRAALDAMNVAR